MSPSSQGVLPPSQQRHRRLPYVDLTNDIPRSDLEELDDYLQSHLDFSSDSHKIAWKNADARGEVGLFTAKGYKHGDSIDLTDRDTSGWCADAFTAYNGKDDFKVCRGHRSDATTWRPNPNARLLPGVMSFARCLPYFEQVGKLSIISNAPNSEGVEHADIEFDDLVSEFVWVRPPRSRKRFYVREGAIDTSEKFEVDASCCVCWFDDHLLHNIESSVEKYQLSIRIDGRFTPEYRKKLCEQGLFADDGLRDVLAQQQEGPKFLQEVNEPPSDHSDDDVSSSDESNDAKAEAQLD